VRLGLDQLVAGSRHQERKLWIILVMNGATNFAYETAEYLIYSSRLGIELSNQNGVMVVDKTFSYDVEDDIKALLKYNNSIHGNLTKAASSLWLDSTTHKNMEFRRRIRKYNSDYRVINNTPVPVAGDKSRGAGLAVAVAVPSNGESYPVAQVTTVMPTAAPPVSALSAVSSAKV
jgi:hypothetical protein